ncbi:FkbM family methyltransferase [Helicobacter sp.]|uniref:FkbM family methyltransferase n=1 Tax=Helicobacter sp. TaxID=218 RepID=UPI0019CD15BD|nr:FkbM family methyltransferase [Helicobacter sp.]MBD5165940.1 FkbM family methyltransferase [Helicobacter sp.]
MVCIDGGAHNGVVTDLILFCGGISYAFEPNTILNGLLQLKYKDNPNVIVSSNALSNKFYSTKFLIDKGGILSQGNRIGQSDMDATQESYDVKVIDLSQVIEKIILPKYQRIYLLKLDIEGEEFNVLDSILTKKLYQHIDFIVCETHERFFSDGDVKMQKLKSRIQEYGAKNIFLDWI